MQNSRIADIFDEMADILEIQEANAFRIRSYRNAARTIRGQSDSLADRVAAGDDLTALPNIGKSTAEKIAELVETGKLKQHEELRAEIPAGLVDLLDVPGLGAKKVKLLHDELGVASLGDLKQAAEDGKVRDLEGMGEKSEQKILRGLETLSKTAGRASIRTAAEHVDALGQLLDDCDAVRKWQVAGSYRRGADTVGDLDFLLDASDRPAATEAIVGHDAVAEVIARGEEKVSVRLAGGLQADFRFCNDSDFGAMLLYFTGSKEHNIALRQRAVAQDWKLNEYGLYSGDKRLAGSTEEAIYKRFGLAWIPPELRESRGEIAAAEADDLPDLIDLGDIRGDLHCHTNETDGKHTIDELVAAARDRGYDYLAITDHSKALRMTNGLDEDRLRKQADEVREIDRATKGFTLLAGIEVDILKDGSLDLDEDVLADLDWVIASTHSHFQLPEDKMTDRLLVAVRSGVVHCLGHPMARLVGRREPIAFDVDKVFAACAEHDVVLEVNAHPDRLDLPAVHCQRARDMGLTLAVNTDTHKLSDMDLMRFGLNVARRGWLTKADVLNTLPAGKLKKRIKR